MVFVIKFLSLKSSFSITSCHYIILLDLLISTTTKILLPLCLTCMEMDSFFLQGIHTSVLLSLTPIIKSVFFMIESSFNCFDFIVDPARFKRKDLPIYCSSDIIS